VSGAHLDRALERGQRLRDLVDKLLLLARQESDQPVAMRQDIDVGEFIRNVVTDFPDPLRQRIVVQAVSPVRSDCFVNGNEELLHAMFRNIVDNALKFSGDQPVIVSVATHGGTVRVEVEDRGPGIPPALQEQIFTPFVRLRSATAAQVQGSGLGLSIVKWIAELHHAKLEIHSENGQGTRFSVELPECK
jgi:signal transduction histidine kinase